MPRSAASLALSERYRQRLVALAERTSATVAARWAAIEGDDLDAEFARWLDGAVPVLAAGQGQAAALSGSYLGAYLTSELGAPQRPPELDLSTYAGVTRDGRPLAALLAPTLLLVKRRIGEGAEVPDALSDGRTRVERLGHTEVAGAGRAALSDAMAADTRVVGYRRVTSGSGCGACLALAGAVSRDGEPMPVHDRCNCTAEPVVRGVPDRVKRPTGDELFDRMSPDEQDARFGEKAAAVREGSARLADLVATARYETGERVIFEASAAAVAE